VCNVTRYSSRINYEVNWRNPVSKCEQKRLNKSEKSGQILRQKCNEKKQITHRSKNQSQKDSESQKPYKSKREGKLPRRLGDY